MDIIKIKEDFINQLQKTKEKIAELEDELDKAKEYKFKLIGGLETLELLEDKQEPNEINTIST
jgi:hypothetical protein